MCPSLTFGFVNFPTFFCLSYLKQELIYVWTYVRQGKHTSEESGGNMDENEN